MCPDGNRQGQHADAFRHLAAKLIPHPVQGEQFERHAVHPHGPGLAIARDHPVLRLQGQRTRHHTGLLPFHLGVGTETPLALQGDGFAVVDAQQPHLAVDLPYLLVVQGWSQGLITGAVRGQNAYHLLLERIIALEEHLLASIAERYMI